MKKMRTNLCLPALLNIPLELIDDFVLLLVPFILQLDGLHVCPVLTLLQLLLHKQEHHNSNQN